MGKRTTPSLWGRTKPISSGHSRPRYAFVTQMLLAAVALTSLGVGIYVGVTGEQAFEVRVMDEATYQRVERLRETMAVTNQDLALMGVSAEQAEPLIASLVAWADENAERLAQADRQVRSAERDLRLAQRAMQSGQTTRDTPQASYTELSKAVDEAKASQRSVLAELETRLSPRLEAMSEDWSAAKLNAGWIADAAGERVATATFEKAMTLREAGVADTKDGASTLEVRRYRERLGNAAAIEAVSRRMYQPPVLVKPLLEPEWYTGPR